MRSLRAWLLRRSLNRELQKELQFHIDEHTHDLVASGLSPDEAKRRACIELGGVDQIAERIRDGRPKAWVDHFVRDVRDALRSLRRTPGLTAAVVTLIALVIGGNTTVFSILHGILTKPAPGVQASGLVTLDLIVNGIPSNGGNSYPNYLDYAAQSTTVHPLVVADCERFTLTVPSGSYALRGELVSTNYFDTLGIRPIAGRAFIGEDDHAQASGLPTVVSERLWQRQFAGAPDVVGQAIALNGHLATIVGVAPPPFAGAVLGESSDIWVPLLPYARVHQTERDVNDRSTLRMWIFGRLTSGTSLAQARAEFAAISRRLQTAYPEANKGQVVFPIPYSAIATGSLLSRQGNYILAIFSVITVLTVLIVCANVANLMLARAAARQRELALRQSLGASRTRIIRMLLAEGVLASTVAWAAACAAAITVSRLLARLLPPDPSGTTINADFTPDWKVAAYAMTLALLGTVAFTLAPAIRAWRQEVLPYLKAGEHGVVQGRSKLASALVVLQLAFSVVLLTGASLAYRSLSVMSRLDLGYKTDHLLLVSMNTAGSAGTPAMNRILLERLRERLRAMPGVASVSHARWTSGWSESVRRRGTDNPVPADQNFIGPGYLETLGLAPLTGQEFAPGDGRRAYPGAIINQHLAETLWPDVAAVGQTLRVGRDQQTVEIVAVIPNALLTGFRRRDANPNFIFRSAQQEPGTPGETTFYIRYAGSLDAVASAIAHAVREVDANVPIVSIRTMETELESAKWPVRAITMLLAIFAVGSLLIAVIGQYAVVTFSMRRRTRDFGLRKALGASSSQILGSVLGEGLRMTMVGLFAGCLLSLGTSIALRRLLYGVSPTDAPTHVGVFVLLAVASAAACYLPARRATRIDPMQALRQE
jgi:putative ABC transport system permease protein